jgi:hypothetical protein
MHRLTCLASALVLTALSSAAFAQQPGGTPEQRAACGPDVHKFCANANPADRTAIPRCLGANRAKLSAACRKVLHL